jgi:hypothetical protein
METIEVADQRRKMGIEDNIKAKNRYFVYRGLMIVNTKETKINGMKVYIC